jgi:prepilin-type N-terminal cleavage/methylation domain-containing protein/prepilin-type processing-associated H-X9-DG protein
MSANRLKPRLLGIAAFTLLELLCVITIIAILAGLLMPSFTTMKQRANSIACASNLRNIGVACQLYLQDHSFIYPCIEALPEGAGSTVYPAGFQPAPYLCMGGSGGAFGAYGVTVQTTQCPSDMASPNPPGCSFAQYGSSYDWKPTLDDESPNEPLVYTRRMQFGAQVSGSTGLIVAKLAKIRQAYDDNSGIHFGHVNALYADGHVVSYTGPTTSYH